MKITVLGAMLRVLADHVMDAYNGETMGKPALSGFLEWLAETHPGLVSMSEAHELLPSFTRMIYGNSKGASPVSAVCDFGFQLDDTWCVYLLVNRSCRMRT